MSGITQRIASAAAVAFARLPFRALYAASDVLCFAVHRVARYRLGIVRANLSHSFPEKTRKELRQIENRFYSSMCDGIVEMFKLLTISPEEMRRRMEFTGAGDVERSLDKRQLCFVYLGHFCNWEWVSTLPLWFAPEAVRCAQLYHPAKSHTANSLLLRLRSRFGSENIPKKDALRRILSMRADGQKTIIGFIADQGPKWVNVHEWVGFLNQDTPVYTGTERIAKKVGACVYFADVSRVSRGHYRCDLQKITDNPEEWPGYALTDEYMRRLEAAIRRSPHCWLWSHNRWKRRRDNEPESVEERNARRLARKS